VKLLPALLVVGAEDAAAEVVEAVVAEQAGAAEQPLRLLQVLLQHLPQVPQVHHRLAGRLIWPRLPLNLVVRADAALCSRSWAATLARARLASTVSRGISGWQYLHLLAVVRPELRDSVAAVADSAVEEQARSSSPVTTR
jgi:hypothetical protein